MFKNVASKFEVFAWDTTTGLAKTGDAANITCYVDKDFGGYTVLGDTSATERDSTNAKGFYLFDAAQAETNADVLKISAKSSTANIAVIGAPQTIFTRPTTGWLAPTTAARTLDVSAGGEAGIDWANIGSPTTAQNLSGTNIDVDQIVASVSGAVGSVASGGITAASIAANAITAAKLDPDVTAELQSGLATAASIAGLNNLSAAAVNAEVVDALNTDTYAEPGQATPGATVSLAAKIGYLYKAWRNKTTSTATQYNLYNDDAATIDQKATLADDATTFTRGEIATGP